MIFRPMEVKNLKKGKWIDVEIAEGDVRVLRRNYCGVYELFSKDNPRKVEYFNDLQLFKIRYGTLVKKFPLINISKQRFDIYIVAEKLDLPSLLKWFSNYGEVKLKKSINIDSERIDYYTWSSYSDVCTCEFQIVTSSEGYTINISKEPFEKIKKVS
ncbi:hypothetical protein [Thermobrachium celere]|uniref:Uncharacterized protein n=1 Tax=Thermobrachium celere DSM 8682 TaxID=941824 RepID=R7RP87_9CLOT|nr:hypothetical protein [Thermobrachium celere]GFR34468.1 hypothetical protein TCEA9_02800 [Thermobrachium celere]CDF57186.1 hypothetical protein TCEL_00081 [Thermobrachium celere DSM 8682]